MERAYTDWELLTLYREWSEDQYAAGFMHPFPDVVQSFRRWLGAQSEVGGLGEGERELLRLYREQEAAEQEGG